MSNVDVVTGLYDSFARGDVPAVLGAMHPEIHWHEAEGNPYMPSGEALVGPDAVLGGVFKRLAEEWDGFAVHPATYHDAGDVVVVELRYSGTHKETGKSIDAQVCHLWTVQDGKVTKFQQYVDTAKMQDAMGAR